MAYNFTKSLAFRCTSFIGLFVIMMILLTLPEMALRAVTGLEQVVFSSRYLAVLSLFCLVMLLDRHMRWTRLILAIIAVIFVMQFAHMAFFGRAFDPFAFAVLGQEAAEISETAFAVLPILWWILPLAILPPVAIYILLRQARPFRGIDFIGILPILVLAFGVYRPINFETVTRGFPNPYQPVIENYVTALGSSIFLLALAEEGDLPDFAPYQIQQRPIQPAEDTTLVVVYGESLGAANFGALGYYRDTTPKLDMLLQDSGAVLHQGIASGISTRIATPLFFNTVRDPRDRENSIGGIGNIFSLAKQQGFDTYYFSAQLSNLLGPIPTSGIDHMITKDTRPELFATRWDEGLVDLLEQEIDWSQTKKRMIVLHTRSAHSPYEKNIQFRPELAVFPADTQLSYAELTRNTYDNSILYNDFLLDRLYRTLLQRVSGAVYFWFTSDHGEMIDYEGRFGHTVLDMAAVQVPIGLLSRGIDEKTLSDFAAARQLTHWDMGRYVLRSLGLELIDPNPDPNLRYVSGTGNFARHGMMILTPKDSEGFDVETVQ